MPNRSPRALSSIRAAMTNPPSVSRGLRGGIFLRSRAIASKRSLSIIGFPFLQTCDSTKRWRFEFRLQVITCSLADHLGIKNVTMELPITLDFLDDEKFTVAFRAGRFLALRHDSSLRSSANESKIIAQLHLQPFEANVEVALR